MSELRLTLLGQTAIHQNGAPLTGFKSSKAVAVLCYLAVAGQPGARTTLIGLLWSELGEANALMNLRHVLANLRELVGDHLVVTRQTVAFQRECPYWLDVQHFETGLKSSNLTAVRAALALYQGDFLAGLEMRQAPLFEEWRSTERTRLRTLAVGALQTLADQSPDPAQAIADRRRLLALEPWRETAHRQLMERLADSGQVNAALAHYESCRQILTEQLAVEPAAETIGFYERLRLATQTPVHRLPIPTTPFVGRSMEIDLITCYLADPVCRCLTLVGSGRAAWGRRGWRWRRRPDSFPAFCMALFLSHWRPSARWNLWRRRLLLLCNFRCMARKNQPSNCSTICKIAKYCYCSITWSSCWRGGRCWPKF